jgi:hypothetical protein
MYRYTAYGLNICSALPLPELKPSTELAATDIVIRWGKVHWLLPEPGPSRNYFHFEEEDAYLYWEVVGKFLVRAGKEIIIEPRAGVEENLLRLPLLGTVLAMALHQRQQLLLHGSAIALGDQAVVFIGASGQGKSTMAATLYGRGHRIMGDDIASINLEKPRIPMLIPGFPQIKLWPEAVTAALGDDPETLRKIHPDVEKRARSTVDRFFEHPLPLRRIYVLAEGSSVQIRPLKPQEAIAKLVGNSYIPMVMGEAFTRSQGVALHIQQCGRLVRDIPVYSLERPRSLALLSAVAHLVEEDLAVAVKV